MAAPGADQVAQLTSKLLGQNLLSIGHQLAPYLEYTINTFYLWQEGILQIPSAQATTNPNQKTSNVSTAVDAAASTTDLQLPAGVIGGPQTQPKAPFRYRPSSSIVRVSAPYGRKVVVISAKRVGVLPVLPDPTPSNNNQTLISVVINPMSPIIMPDMKSRIFRITAQYVYSLTQPLWGPDGLWVAPESSADGYTRVPNYNIGTVQFVKGLI